MTKAERAYEAAQRRFWEWEELYSSALKSLIDSLGKGRKMSAPAMVKFAIQVADEGTSARNLRRPKALAGE